MKSSHHQIVMMDLFRSHLKWLEIIAVDNKATEEERRNHRRGRTTMLMSRSYLIVMLIRPTPHLTQIREEWEIVISIWIKWALSFEPASTSLSWMNVTHLTINLINQGPWWDLKWIGQEGEVITKTSPKERRPSRKCRLM